jgi:tetratricopeptide (TPR) repeat protein
MMHLLSLCIALSFAISPFEIYENNKGVETITNGEKLDPSYFNRLIQSNSEEWILYWNQIVANIINEDYSTATQTLKWVASILPKKEELMRFYVYYQLGRVYAHEKKVTQALEAYQNALDIYPDSKEVTVNIELLAQSGGGGGGGGEDEQQDQNKEQQKQDQNQQQKPQEDKPNQDDSGPKPTPKPFDSKDLSKEDVKRILDELKRQEEQIRAKMDDSKPKEKGLGKDW